MTKGRYRVGWNRKYSPFIKVRENKRTTFQKPQRKMKKILKDLIGVWKTICLSSMNKLGIEKDNNLFRRRSSVGVSLAYFISCLITQFYDLLPRIKSFTDIKFK